MHIFRHMSLYRFNIPDPSHHREKPVLLLAADPTGLTVGAVINDTLKPKVLALLPIKSKAKPLSLKGLI